MSTTDTKVPFTETDFPQVLRMGKAELKSTSEGRGKLATAAKNEIARRKANRAAAQATA